MDSLTCGICLDQLTVPVSTPCGHLCCEACLMSYIETSADAMNASCPTCRAPFTIAIPDLRFVPKKYHTLIMPSIRRVFIADASDNAQPLTGASTNTNRELRAQIATLTDNMNALVRDKGLLMDRCEAAIRARDVHAQGERGIRLDKERLERELKDLRRKYDCVKDKYKALKASQQQNAPLGPAFALAPASTTTSKRKSHQAALDALLDASLVSTSASTSGGHLPLSPNASSDTPAGPARIPKRPRLLGSPFDLAKRVASRPSRLTRVGGSGAGRGRSALLIDAGEEGDSGFRASDFDMELGFDFDFDPEIEGDFDLDETVSSSGGPQRSGLPSGDVFSPRAARGGRGSISFEFGNEEDEREEERDRSGSVRLGGVRPTWMLSPVDE